MNVWSEDREHESFAREILTLHGVEKRRIHFNTAPSGGGSAALWVTRQFQAEVLPSHRATAHQANLGYLVMVDGDNLGMVGRLRFLGEIPTERLAILVPTWSIETWVLHLIGEAVTEDQPLKERLPRSEFPEALKRAMLSWPNPRPEEAVVVPSLARAREELKNLPL